jgi:hypothetical protein
MLAKECVHDAVFGRQRAGVRSGRRGAPGRHAGLERDDRQAALARNVRCAGELGRVGDRFEIQQHQLHFGVERHGQRKVGHRQVAFVARGVGVAHAYSLLAEKRVGHDAHRAGLADDPHRAVLRLDFAEDGRERCDGAGLEVGDALRVRPDDAHAGCARRGDHFVLCFPAGFAHLTEAGGNDHGHFHAAFRATGHGGNGAHARHGDDCQVRRFGHRSNVGVGLEALDLGAVRVDREDPALVARAQHVLDRPAADLFRIVRGADDCDRFRIKRRAQTIVGREFFDHVSPPSRPRPRRPCATSATRRPHTQRSARASRR